MRKDSINLYGDHEASFVMSQEEEEEQSKASSTNRSGRSLSTPSPDELAEKKHFVDESKSVSRWRCMLIVMLVFTASSVVSAAYVFLTRAEDEEFEHAFSQSAETLVSSIGSKTKNLVQALSTMADAITGDIMVSDQEVSDVELEWPNVVNHHFEIKAAHVRLDSFAEVVIFAPHVHDFERKEWEAFSVAQQHWLDESKELLEITKHWFDSSAHTHIGDEHHEDEHHEDEHHEEEHHDEEHHDEEHHDEEHHDEEHGRREEETTYHDSGDEENHAEAAEQHISPVISRLDNGVFVPESNLAQFLPAWQISPPPANAMLVNYNLATDEDFGKFINAVGHGMPKPALSKIMFPESIMKNVFTSDDHEHEADVDASHADIPHVIATVPVKDGFSDDSEEVALLIGVLTWGSYLSNVLPVGVNGIQAVVKNTCGQIYSYRLDGPTATYIGSGVRQEDAFGLRRTVKLSEIVDFANVDDGACEYTIEIYPSSASHDDYHSARPEMFTAALVAVFVMTSIVFFIYHYNVAHRQAKVLATVLKNDAIVSSLFPSTVRDRILRDAEERVQSQAKAKSSLFDGGSKLKLKSFLEDEPQADEKSGLVFGSRPIADLFPETTIMFADMVGFTAWSSVREPSQVFMLLETVYHAFDELANRRRVFKVETVGDCYVAVAGLPEARPDHAIVMARYATECNAKLNRLTKELEVSLGPDTGDLSMRFGLHSGPVTAGVLRGERARFQLFGDTMNMASRMESSGKRGNIQVSPETAKLLTDGGKGHWLKPREEKVFIKGKGEMETFWCHVRGEGTVVSTGSSSVAEPVKELHDSVITAVSIQPDLVSASLRKLDEKAHRLIDWNTDLLLRLLRQVVATRMSTSGRKKVVSKDPVRTRPEGSTILDEVCEIITLPQFDATLYSKIIDPDTVQLGAVLEDQVRSYVGAIAMMYRQNSFHSFDHASHVAMSVAKLLSRIVAPSDLKVENEKAGDQKAHHTKYASTLHDHTYGITSDPLTQFACVLSALIHDVDHTGVPNVQLVKENKHLASRYKNQSVAEQNSVDLGWSLLMEDEYDVLRKTICATDSEFRRFRQLVVNSVMATDIVDKELKNLRNQRWDKAFHRETVPTSEIVESEIDKVNRKATIVIEHLIQASDVAHTMQHWHIYRKWNERLFEEMYVAYKMGRAENDPTDGWYKGELGFFDFYIIPLAKKLKDCGVFGVSSFEYLDYAERNRREWEAKGREVVEEMKNKMMLKTKDEWAMMELKKSMILSVNPHQDATEGWL